MISSTLDFYLPFQGYSRTVPSQVCAPPVQFSFLWLNRGFSVQFEC